MNDEPKQHQQQQPLQPQTLVMPAAAPTTPHTPYMVPMPTALHPGAVVHQQEIPKLPRHQGVGDKADKKTWVLYQSYLQKIAQSSTPMHRLVPMPIS